MIGVVLYVAVMLAAGIFVARKSSSLSDFAVSGRNMSLTVCSISIVATWFGAGPMMGSAAAAYSGNVLQVLLDPVASGFSLLIAGFATFVVSPTVFPDMPASFVAFWVSGGITVIVSFATQKNDPPRALTNADGEAIDLNNRFGTLPLFRRVEQ